MKQKVLITGSSNYIGDMDLQFFRILSLDEWAAIKVIAKELFDKTKDTVTFWIGTNQGVPFESYAEWEKTFKIRLINDAEQDQLEILFGKKIFNEGFGAGACIIGSAIDIYRDYLEDKNE
jgi:hypothetical protein